MKILVLLLLGLIVATLAEGFYYLAKDSGAPGRRRLITALTARILLSLLLFALLMAGGSFGWL